MRTEDRKNALIQKAYELFITQGYEETSVDMVINACHIAKWTFYYHFKCKDDLFEAVVNMILDHALNRLSLIMDLDMPADQKLLFAVTSLNMLDQEKGMEEQFHKPDNARLHARINERLIEESIPAFVTLLEQARKEGIVHCSRWFEQRIRMSLILALELFPHPNPDPDDIAAYIDLLEKIFETEPGRLQFVSSLIRQEAQRKEQSNEQNRTA